MPHECTNCSRTFPDGSKEMLSGCPDCGGKKFQYAPSGRTATGSADSSTTEPADSSSPESVGPADSSTPGTTVTAADDAPGSVDGSDAPSDEYGEPAQSGRTVDDPTETVREWVASRLNQDESTAEAAGTRRSDDRSTDSDSADGRATIAETENTAQADARSEVVSTDELPPGANRWSPSARDQPERDVTSSDAAPKDVTSSDAAPDIDGDADPPEADPGSSGPSREPDTTSTDPDVDGDADPPPDHGRVVSEPSGDQPSIEELRAELNEQFESIKILSPGQYELNLMELYDREEYIISLQEDGRYVIDVPDSWRGAED